MDGNVIERQLKALANKRRIEILFLLKNNGAMSVEDISEKISLSYKSTSKHLRKLLASEFVVREQVSFEAGYSYNGAGIKSVGRFIERLSA